MPGKQAMRIRVGFFYSASPSIGLSVTLIAGRVHSTCEVESAIFIPQVHQ